MASQPKAEESSPRAEPLPRAIDIPVTFATGPICGVIDALAFHHQDDQGQAQQVDLNCQTNTWRLYIGRLQSKTFL
jgi:hypothetical protein